MATTTPLEALCDALGSVYRDARSSAGHRVVATFEQTGPASARVLVSVFDDAGDLAEMREWERGDLCVDVHSDAAAAFVEGHRRAANDLDEAVLYPDDFPAWPLLSSRSCSADEVASAMRSEASLHRALAALALADAVARDPSLPPLDERLTLSLFELSRGSCGDRPMLAHARALAASSAGARHLLDLLCSWHRDLEQNGFDDWLSADGGQLRPFVAGSVAPALARSLEDADRARLDALVGGPLLPAPSLDLDDAFSARSVAGFEARVVVVGTVRIDDGRASICDPYAWSSACVEVPPGDYALRLLLVALPDWGTRVAAARIDPVAGPPPRLAWVATGVSFSVDAGLASFCSERDRKAFAASLEAFRSASPDGNYHDSHLAPSLAESASDERPCGDWCVHLFAHEGQQHALAVCASGLGDGHYDVLAGNDGEGRVVSLAVDFAVLP